MRRTERIRREAGVIGHTDEARTKIRDARRRYFATDEGRAAAEQSRRPFAARERVYELYFRDGLTQREIATEFGVTQPIVTKWMRRWGFQLFTAAEQRRVSRITPPMKRSRYRALHDAVREARGTPARCDVCECSGSEDAFEWANLTGEYENVQDYARMCRPCHNTYDRRLRRQKLVALWTTDNGEADSGRFFSPARLSGGAQ